MKSNLSTTFLFVLIVAVGIGAYFVFKPFLLAILLAFLVSQFFNGWYQKINKQLKERKALASLLTCLIVFVILILPFALVSVLVTSEAGQFFRNFESENLETRFYELTQSPLAEKINLNLENLNFQSLVQQDEFKQTVKNVSTLVLKGVKGIYVGGANIIFTIFIMFFSLYYLFKDGERIVRKITKLSPLREDQEQMLLEKFISISKATLKGSFVIAIIQGLLLWLTYWIAGVSSPVFWGVLSSFAALIPMVGAGLIWVPVGIVMLLLGNIWQGVFIFLVGSLVVGSVDNLIRPRLVGNKTRLHPLLVFLSTLGGIALFGFWGILFGPIIIVLFLSLLDIYGTEFKGELEKLG